MITVLALMTGLMVLNEIVEFPLWLWDKYLDWKETRWLKKHLRMERR